MITEPTAFSAYADGRALLAIASGNVDVELRVESPQHLRELADRLVELADGWSVR